MDRNQFSYRDSDLRRQIAEELLTWFFDHARDLPWRRNRTPYRVWVAEVMLQQTRVDTVIPYFERFLERFPSVQALSEAPLGDVLKVWEGLGYYARARRLHQAARQLMSANGGDLPQRYDSLKDLPGIGPYTAGAIASISFGQDVPAVDGNARRVLSRLFCVRKDVTRSAAKRELRDLAAWLLPAGQAGPFNEGLMELGATVCTPREPLCAGCPLRDRCRAYAEGEQQTLPIRSPRGATPHHHVAAAVTTRNDGAVLVAQRNVEDMLGGLWEFPGGTCEEGENLRQCLVREMEEELGVIVEAGQEIAVVEHAYTHFRMTLHAFWCRLVRGEPRCLDCAAVRWVQLEELEGLPMSVADRKIAGIVRKTPFPPCRGEGGWSPDGVRSVCGGAGVTS